MKVLTLGHSLGNDSNWMLSLIANAEGCEDLTVGFLYYSGCALGRHVRYMTENIPDYNLYLSSSATPNEPPTVIEHATMRRAIVQDDWDVIVMQGGVFEIAEDETYTNGNIQKIQDYVNTHKKNPNAIFLWHMPWPFATEWELQKKKSEDPEKNSYYKGYQKYDNDRSKFYTAAAKCVNDHILTDKTFVRLIPTGTAFENALSSYLTEFELHRDYAHATDLARVIAAYTFFCVVTGVKQLTEIKLDVVPGKLRKSKKVQDTDKVLTDNEKALILEAVNNALKEPLKVTQSQYIERPADYIYAW